MKFWGTLFSVVLLDQLTKHWIAGRLALGESRTVIDGLLWLTYIINPGASFGILRHQTWLFITLAVVMVAAIIYYQAAYGPQRWLQYALGLIAGGALGNLIDRLRFQAVQDFIDLGWWPVFNLADTAITIGGALLILYLLANELGQDRD